MNILASAWLQRMADKAGNAPRLRMLALFDILADWLEAPGMRDRLESAVGEDAGALRAYLAGLAAQAGAKTPAALASQLYCLLVGALQQELRDPHSHALMHAKHAAASLMAPPEKRLSLAVAGMATASLAVIAVTLTVAIGGRDEQAPTAPMVAAVAAPAAEPSNPDRIAAAYHLHDKIAAGQCAYPQALMLPPEQRSIYLEKVVADGGDVAPAARPLVDQLYQRVECYYPPAAMLL